MNTSLESFAPVARRYRRWRLLSQCTFALCLLNAAIEQVFSIEGHLRRDLNFILWLMAFVPMLLTEAFLKCTECRSSLSQAEGEYCPECGSRSLSIEFGDQPRVCVSCGVRLAYRKGHRKFKVRYCSQCGSHLDEKGL